MFKVFRFALTLVFSVCFFAVSVANGATEWAAGPVRLSAHTIQYDPDENRFHCFGDAELTQRDVSLFADEIRLDSTTGFVAASGNVRFSDSEGMISTDEFNYNFFVGEGKVIKPTATLGPLKIRAEAGYMTPAEQLQGRQERFASPKLGVFQLLGGSATTCDKEHPHYQIKAREILLYPGEPPRIVAKGVAIWLGNLRVFHLPNLAFKLSGGIADQTSLFPRLGFDGDDGMFAGYNFQSISSARSNVNWSVRGTTRQGIQGAVFGEWLVHGKTAGFMEPQLISTGLELRSLPLIRPKAEKIIADRPTDGASSSQIRIFATGMHHQKTYDYGVERLWLSKLPEIGLKYEGAPINDLVMGGKVSHSAMISYGRLSESPGLKNISRFDARALITTDFAKLGEKTALSSGLLARYSNYDTGDDYRVLAGSLNLAHRLSQESYASIRLIKHYTSGNTPLESDDVDVETELQGALWHRFGKNVAGAEIEYDLKNNSITDWGLSYGRTVHCLEPRITWRNKFNTIDLDVKVVGF